MQPRLERLVAFARAKVNLTLRVLGRRPDGYHEIVSLVAFTDGVGDTIVVERADVEHVTVAGPQAGTLQAQSNAGSELVTRALERVRAMVPELPPLHVHLEKFIPLVSGLGGGSSDAGAALRLLDRFTPTLTPRAGWDSIARELGADVPACVMNRTLLMRGRGEDLTRLQPPLPPIYALLARSDIAVPADKTAAVFRALGAEPLGAKRLRRTPLPDLSTYSGLMGYLAAQPNDLERAALEVMPGIAEVIDELARLPGSDFVRLSGAGPTAYALFATADAVDAAADALIARRPGWWVGASQLGQDWNV